MKKFPVLVLIILFLGVLSAKGSETEYSNQIVAKIPGKSITCIVRINNGALLAGTNSGVYYILGHSISKAFEGYKGEELFNEKAIHDICQMGDNIYLATNSGLIRINNRSGKISKVLLGQNEEEEINRARVNCLFVSSRERLWAGLNGYGAVTIIEDTPINYRYQKENDKSIANDTVYAIDEDANGLIWLATGENFLNRFNINLITFERIRIKEKRSLTVSDVLIQNKKIYITTKGNGIIEYLPGKLLFNKIAYDTNCPQCINSISKLVSFNNELWFSTESSGLHKNLHLLPANSEEYQKVSGSFTSSISSDKDGVVYGTYDGLIGTITVSEQGMPSVDFLDQSENRLWISTFSDYQYDRYWIGTQFGELFLFDKTRILMSDFIYPDTNNRNFEYGICNLVTDDLGNLWIGTKNKGLFHYDPIGEKIINWYYHTKKDSLGIASNTINDIYTDDLLNLWLATPNGVVKYNYDADSFALVPFYKKDIKYPAPPFINTIISDDIGQIWLGTKEGLWRKTKKNSYFSYYDNNLLADYNVTSVFQFEENGFIIGTKTDVLQLNTLTNTAKILVKSNTSENPVEFILSDMSGNIWIGQQTDLLKYIPGEKRIVSCQHYFKNTQNLLISDGFIDAKGSVYIGTSDGTYRFNPKEFEVKEKEIDIVLHHLVLNNREITVGKKYYTKRILKRNLNAIEKLVLPRQARNISLQAVDPYMSDVPVFYRLNGYDKTWVRLSSDDNRIAYTNLPFGVYNLQIGIKEANGEYLPVHNLKIKIRRPIWRTWFFLLIVLGMATFSVLRFIRTNKEQVRGKLKEYEKELDKKKEELDFQENILESEKIILDKRAHEEKVLRYHSNGLAEFSETLSKYHNNITELIKHFIIQLVEYVGGHQGAVYRLNEENPENVYLEVAGLYTDNDKIKKSFKVGEGYIGTCFEHAKEIVVDNIPDTFSYVKSGLGEEAPNHLILMPIVHNELKLGVVEISSFHHLEEHKIELVRRVTENVASGMAIAISNTNFQKMLAESREQSELLKSNEEEMRQNMEEMMATQEEMERNKEELSQRTLLLNAMLINLKEYIYFKDTDSKFILASESMVKALGFDRVEEMIGKSDFDFYTEEHARPAFEDEKKIMETREPILNQVEKETHKDGSVTYANTSKLPLIDESDNVIGTFGISTDVTNRVELENELLTKNKELEAREEKLTMNIEELRATQEEMERINAEVLQNEKELKEKQVQLEFEQILFNALMDNIDARVTFKDREAKYVRINSNKLKALGVKDQSEVVGLDDNDIFGESHGKAFIEKEKANIAKGQKELNNTELIKYKDGRLSWGSTSRIPLSDKEGEIVGGLVVTFDVTKQENALVQIEQMQAVFNKIQSELPVIYFTIDNEREFTEIRANALTIAGIKDASTTKEKAAVLNAIFPMLKESLQNQKEATQIEQVEEVLLGKNKFIVKHFVLPTNTTHGGYMGVSIFENKGI